MEEYPSASLRAPDVKLSLPREQVGLQTAATIYSFKPRHKKALVVPHLRSNNETEHATPLSPVLNPFGFNIFLCSWLLYGSIKVGGNLTH